MGLFGRTRVTAGLDIGSGFVKLVVIDHSRSDPEIVKIATSPLIPDAIVEGEVMDPVMVAETIRSVKEAADLKTNEVVAAVGGHDVIIKKIQMDRRWVPVTEEELKAANPIYVATITAEIRGHNEELYGYLIYAQGDRVQVKIVDEKTVKLSYHHIVRYSN